MIMEFRDGLLFTEIEIKHNNKKKILDNIVVDTGATKTLISQEAVKLLVLGLVEMTKL